MDRYLVADRARTAMASRRSVKITINIDSDSLAKLKEVSAGGSLPYQRLLNQILNERLARRRRMRARLDRVEKELASVKKRIAA